MGERGLAARAGGGGSRCMCTMGGAGLRWGRGEGASTRTSFLTAGLRWLCQRSRHCLPIRLGRSAAMRLQLDGPCCSTSSSSFLSSSPDHACLRTADLGASPDASSLRAAAAGAPAVDQAGVGASAEIAAWASGETAPASAVAVSACLSSDGAADRHASSAAQGAVGVNSSSGVASSSLEGGDAASCRYETVGEEPSGEVLGLLGGPCVTPMALAGSSMRPRSWRLIESCMPGVTRCGASCAGAVMPLGCELVIGNQRLSSSPRTAEGRPFFSWHSGDARRRAPRESYTSNLPLPAFITAVYSCTTVRVWFSQPTWLG